MNKTKKSIVVIGAGPSGLVAIKEMLAEGHDVVAIEKASDIGGVFRVSDDWSYKNLYLTISNMLMAFSDFAPLEGYLNFSSQEQYFSYLKEYAKHFDIMKYIHLNTQVQSAVLETPDGKWNVTAKNKDGKIIQFFPDTVIVATGSNHKPNKITLPGLDFSTGGPAVIHSSEFRDGTPFKDKRVLIIGTGESASDIAYHTKKAGASSVSLWSRRYQFTAARFTRHSMGDKHVSYDEYKLLENQQTNPPKPSDLLEAYTTSRFTEHIPTGIYSIMLQEVAWRGVPKQHKDGSNARLHWMAQWCRNASKDHYFDGVQTSPSTKTALLSIMASEGKLNSIIAPTAKFDGNKITFHNAEWINKELNEPKESHTIEVDAVILCTGFKTDLDWIHLPDEYKFETKNPRTWYKHCFPPKLGTKLVFLGWTRPHQGGIPACSELLARYVALLLSNKRQLPNDYAELAIMEGKMEDAHYCTTPHYTTLVDYPSFTESVSKLIGCLPKSPSPFTSFERFFQYWMYPAWPCWYRRCGPGANQKVLDETLALFPTSKSWNWSPLYKACFPIFISTILFSNIFASLPVVGSSYRTCGRSFGWRWLKPKNYLLSNNNMEHHQLSSSFWVQSFVWVVVPSTAIFFFRGRYNY